MTRYLLDTDTVIDFLKGYSSIIEFINGLYQQGETLCTCDVVVAEAFAGFHPHQREHGQTLLESMRFLPTSPRAARQAGSWRHDFARRGRQLSTVDCLIAATAVDHRATLVTGNVRDYPMVEVILMPLSRRT
jgi:predicted nucleic acid-binding protein